MKQVACHYAIVRFMPFVETGEFANVGILAVAPDRRFFDFRLQDQRYKRITGFFEDADAQLFKATMRSVKNELERVQALLQETNFGDALNYFREIVRPRETIARYSEARFAVTTDPSKELDKLYRYYVEREFVTREYREKNMERAVQKILTKAHLEKRFKRKVLTDGLYEATLPFVEGGNGRPIRAIKPLNLAYDRPARIINHAGEWAFKFKMLKKHRLAPKKMLFAVAGKDGTTQQEMAYQDAMTELRTVGAEVLPIDDKERITAFATH